MTPLKCMYWLFICACLTMLVVSGWLTYTAVSSAMSKLENSSDTAKNALLALQSGILNASNTDAMISVVHTTNHLMGDLDNMAHEVNLVPAKTAIGDGMGALTKATKWLNRMFADIDVAEPPVHPTAVSPVAPVGPEMVHSEPKVESIDVPTSVAPQIPTATSPPRLRNNLIEKLFPRPPLRP